MKYQLYINAPIGWPISAQYVRSVLAEHEGKHVDVYVNSFGGSVVDALDIRQQFLDHGDVTCHIFGMTASAATLLAMGAKEVRMSRHALFLVHQCSSWVDTWGRMNSSELADAISKLQKQAEDLATVDQVAANIYADRTGKDAKLCAEWMKEAKWLTSEKCLEMGLIDSICEDGSHTDVTDELRAEMVACGLPLPIPSRDGKSMTKLDQFIAAVRQFFADGVSDAEDTKDAKDANEDRVYGEGVDGEGSDGERTDGERTDAEGIGEDRNCEDEIDEDEIGEDEDEMEDVIEDEGTTANLETTQHEMEQTYAGAICAVLGVESIGMTAEGHIALTEAQMTALEERLSVVDDLTAERDALKTQVGNLLSGDGADDTDIEGDGGEDTSIADCFKALESIL